ncbi:MAG: hypothetical protein K6G30_00065 [Acetatifactor sp.]|nr:hypothetical protein [Acetatifactor sp.]
MRTFVVADDITGANDIGLMYRRAGYRVITYCHGSSVDYDGEHEVTIVDTDSRFCTPEEAYDRVFTQVLEASKHGYDRFFNKQCSVFRGNIGAEFDAMLDALGEERGMVIAAYPDTGRTTVQGIHYVNGILLENSQFKNDPIHPTRESMLENIIHKQSLRETVIITQTDLQSIKWKEKTKKAAYAVFDAESNQDLKQIARKLAGEKVICGSAGIAYYLGLEEQEKKEPLVLSVAGSLTLQTRNQIEYMKEKGYPCIELNTMKIVSSEGEGKKEIERVLSSCSKAYNNASFVVLHSMNTSEEVNETKKIAAAGGYTNAEASKKISKVLAFLTKEIKERLGVNRYIILGGDTSAAFCNILNITKMEVSGDDIQGVPVLKNEEEQRFILKSGSFGQREFIEMAYQKMKQ